MFERSIKGLQAGLKGAIGPTGFWPTPELPCTLCIAAGHALQPATQLAKGVVCPSSESRSWA